jgi:hypothetical protein
MYALRKLLGTYYFIMENISKTDNETEIRPDTGVALIWWDHSYD